MAQALSELEVLIMPLNDKTVRISDLVSCYTELASGVSVEHLFEKYVKAEVLIAFELFERGVTLNELANFIKRRNEHVDAMLSTPPKKVIVFSKGLKRKC